MIEEKDYTTEPVVLRYNNMVLTMTSEGVEVAHLNNKDINFFTWKFVMTKKWSTPFTMAKLVAVKKKWFIREKDREKVEPQLPQTTYECTHCKSHYKTYIEAEVCHWAYVYKHRKCDCHGYSIKECPASIYSKKKKEEEEEAYMIKAFGSKYVNESEPIEEEVVDGEFAWLKEFDRPARKRGRR